MTQNPQDADLARAEATAVAAAAGATSVEAQGMNIVAKSQNELIRARFLRHKGAMGGLIVLVAVTLLAFTSVGYGPIPGWWHFDYSATGEVVDGGVMSATHPFGQDDLGKDYFALVMRGAEQSLIIAFTVGIVSTVLGVMIGALSGFFGGWVETVLMRLTDVVITVPILVIASVVGSAFGDGGIMVLALVLGVLIWTTLARMIRAQFLSLREKEFVEAARAMGASPWRIIFKHILPNTMGVVIVNATLTIATAILLETVLSFLGFGVRPPDSSLGLLISTYQSASQTRPWLFWWPGLFIITIALAVNFIGDGLRDAYDPRQGRTR